MKRYLIQVMLFVLAGLMLICAASYVIDPYGIYMQQADFFPRKVAAADKGRTVKPYQSLNSAPYTLLVGNSRVEIGMPIEHAFYQQKPVFNMGLPGANVAMQYDYALHAINNSNTVRQVVIGLDFLDFSSSAGNVKTTIERNNWQWRLKGFASEHSAAPRRYVAERISMLFSLTAITDSTSTVFSQKRNMNALNKHGFNDGRLYHFHVRNEGYGALYQQKQDELDARLSAMPQVFNAQSYQIAELRQFIETLKQRNISTYLIINPYQKPYLDTLQRFGLNDALAAWKAQMANIATQHNLALYDFAIESAPVLNVVSAKSRSIDDSPYFWEPAHYKTQFGEQILNVLVSGKCAELCQQTQ